MRTTLITLILAATAATSLPATAAAQSRAQSRAQTRWKEIGKTSSGNAVLVDPASMKTVNGITTMRVEVKFTPPVKTPKGDWYLSRHIALFDCAKKAVGAKESVYYGDAAATKVMEKKVIAQPGLGSPIGGSMTQVAFDYVCRAR
jgi:surface-adhesin protein E